MMRACFSVVAASVCIWWRIFCARRCDFWAALRRWITGSRALSFSSNVLSSSSAVSIIVVALDSIFWAVLCFEKIDVHVVVAVFVVG